jgi:hypothetical protein
MSELVELRRTVFHDELGLTGVTLTDSFDEKSAVLGARSNGRLVVSMRLTEGWRAPLPIRRCYPGLCKGPARIMEVSKLCVLPRFRGPAVGLLFKRAWTWAGEAECNRILAGAVQPRGATYARIGFKPVGEGRPCPVYRGLCLPMLLDRAARQEWARRHSPRLWRFFGEDNRARM